MPNSSNRRSDSYDAVVVGSGPNGLAAAVALAQRGRSVLVLEAQATIGGGARSAELTLPGFVHDTCSAIHPMAVASPFFQTLALERYGLKWIEPPAVVAHPLDGQPAVLVERSVEATAAGLEDDGDSYCRLVRPLVASSAILFRELLGPLSIPRHPTVQARFGLRAIQSAWRLAHGWFTTQRARALFAGVAAHSFLPLRQAPSAAVGLMLLIAGHACGWPLPQGGAQALSNALAELLRSLGGKIVVDCRVSDIDQLPYARVILLDLTPRQVVQLAGHRLPPGYRRALERYRYGPGIFKIDWALSEPIPWSDPNCRRAATVHLGGTIDEIAASEAAAWTQRPSDRPYVLVAQPSLFDPTRAPEGRHTAWTYCHVPHGSTVDMRCQIEQQLERFAPGFRDCVLAQHIFTPATIQLHNENYIGGDINGGAQDFGQLYTRPVAKWRPYRTALPKLYICSSSTPPGGGVHGMCGYHAAQTALNDHFR
jgi:phytoene dehydrogenase-like protein